MFSQSGSWKSENIASMLTDAIWSSPQYYSTIQTNKIQVNKCDELILTARGAAGLYFSRLDPVTRKWSPLQLGLNLSDASGWADPKYYKTIRTNVVKIDGQDHLILIGRSAAGIISSIYNPLTNKWTPYSTGPALANNSGWGVPKYYETIQTNVMHIGGHDQLVLSARGVAGVHISIYDPEKNVWSPLQLGTNFSDANGWGDPENYKTIQTKVMKIDGHDQLVLMGRGCECIRYSIYNPSTKQWTALQSGPSLSDKGGWSAPKYYETIQTSAMQIDGRDQLMMCARGAAGMYTSIFDPKAKGWSSLQLSTNFSDASGWVDPKYYKTIQSKVMKIDGRDQLVLIGRGASNLRFSIYNPSTKQWTSLQNGPALSDASGWSSPACYETLKCNVVKVDGEDKLILNGRSKDGVHHEVFHQNLNLNAAMEAIKVINNFVWKGAEIAIKAANNKSLNLSFKILKSSNNLLLNSTIYIAKELAAGKNIAEVLAGVIPEIEKSLFKDVVISEVVNASAAVLTKFGAKLFGQFLGEILFSDPLNKNEFDSVYLDVKHQLDALDPKDRAAYLQKRMEAENPQPKLAPAKNNVPAQIPVAAKQPAVVKAVTVKKPVPTKQSAPPAPHQIKTAPQPSMFAKINNDIARENERKRQAANEAYKKQQDERLRKQFEDQKKREQQDRDKREAERKRQAEQMQKNAEMHALHLRVMHENERRRKEKDERDRKERYRQADERRAREEQQRKDRERQAREAASRQAAARHHGGGGGGASIFGRPDKGCTPSHPYRIHYDDGRPGCAGFGITFPRK